MSKLIKITDAEYFAAEGMNASSLKWYKKGSQHFEIMRQLKRNKKTKSLDFGDAGHKLLLEPEKFYEEYTVKPEGMSFVNKEGKAWKAENENKTILTASEWEKLDFYNAYWNLHPWSKMGSMNEVAIFAEVEGVLCKIKLIQVSIFCSTLKQRDTGIAMILLNTVLSITVTRCKLGCTL